MMARLLSNSFNLLSIIEFCTFIYLCSILFDTDGNAPILKDELNSEFYLVRNEIDDRMNLSFLIFKL